MYPHRIRLRGPWECEVGPRPGRVALPCTWEQLAVGDGPASVQLVRSFGYPGRLDDCERVWLTFTGVRGLATVVLNDEALGPGQGDFEFEVTRLLRPRNRLSVGLGAENPAGLVWEEVALEIRREAFLRATARRAGPDVIQVSGVVVGSPGPTLELYALAGGRNVHYQTLAAGESFQFTVAGFDPELTGIRLELIHVSTVWYAVDVPVAAA